jgi:ectoine hydroxylase-related dioxygenase (phytanoyl-CoA dioxygenase family)
MGKQTERPRAPAETEPIVARFHADGYALVRGVLDREELAALRAEADRIFADPEQKQRHAHGFDFVIARLHTGNPLFEAMLFREPIPSLVGAVLGDGFGVVGQNVIRNPPGTAISHWHVDDVVEFPLPEGVPRHDARLRMPVLWLTVQIPLTDIETEAEGPTQCVPGSHYAGRRPPEEEPVFEGRGPVSLLCRVGDLYLQNHQCWHRGAPNRSPRTRYVLQQQYGARWAIRRFTGLG